MLGVIVGSMGLSGSIVQSIITRLCLLISAANKKHVVFIMGKLNESKLCNFPEIDLFCLITNEDVAVIKPKTFPVPVITPWELEIGLEARELQGFYDQDVTSLLQGDEGLSYDDSLAPAICKVRAAYISDLEDKYEVAKHRQCDQSVSRLDD